MIVGYKLIRVSDCAVVREWGGVYGSCPGFPNPIILPNGDHVHGGTIDVEYGGHKVIAWEMGPSAADVKTEARRRILSAFPEWKQTNMIARGLELQDVWRRNGSWSAGEQAESDALAAAWAWIKLVRAASDGIEAINPVPDDYAHDGRWP